jgi:multidrug efflux pump subunit AcrA (membrane-fusion protein)
VQTAIARAQSSQAATGKTLLNASGYVTARRAATVSSKVTGKVVEILIEEGVKV